MPQPWNKLWEGPETGLEYLSKVAHKAAGLTRWLQLCRDKKVLDHEHDLATLFTPGTLLMAFRQRCARSTKTAIDKLTLSCSFGAGTGLKLANLLLQGAGFQAGQVVDAF